MSFSLTSLPKLLFILSPTMDPFNALSTIAVARKTPPLKVVPTAKVMSCTLVTSIDQEKTLDAAKEVTGGAALHRQRWPTDRPTLLADRPWFVANRSPVMRAIHHQCANVPSPCTRGHGTHLAHALSPHPTIRKERRSVTPTPPTTGILTPRKVTIRR
jgi:hypothetical protein